MAMQAVRISPNGPKLLRIGVIQRGKIVEERVIRNRETVTVGTSEKNHFIINSESLPARFEMFQLIGSDYILNFTDGMTGRVGLSGGVQELEKLRSSGAARNAGAHWQVKLNESSRGKVVIGDTTFLFQFVSPPPVQPRPQLPAAARGGMAKTIDWMFTAFVVFSYMIFFGFIVYLESADFPLEDDFAEIPDDVAEFIFEEPDPPEEETEAEEPEEAEEEEAPKKQVVRAKATASASASKADPRNNAAERAKIAAAARQQAEALVIGAFGEGGALADVLRDGAVTGSLSDVLAQADGVGVATSQSSSLRTRAGGGGSGQGGDLGSLAAAGGDATKARSEGGAIKEKRVRGKVSMRGGDEIGGNGVFEQSLVTRMIKARSSAFRRCYETALKSNPSMSGKVVVRFTIMERGNVSSAKATTNSTGDSGLGSCVVGVVKRLRWRQGPDGGSVTFEYPFVFAPQG